MPEESNEKLVEKRRKKKWGREPISLKKVEQIFGERIQESK